MEANTKVKSSINQGIKASYWITTDGNISISWAYDWIGKIYLKIGTQQAIDYYESLKTNQYYEDNSEFKNMVIIGLNDALLKQLKYILINPNQKKIEANS